MNASSMQLGAGMFPKAIIVHGFLDWDLVSHRFKWQGPRARSHYSDWKANILKTDLDNMLVGS